MGYYIQTEASDPDVAKAQGVNYVPKLANAISDGVTDDIYVVTNFKQANVIPSAPIPAGPSNTDPDYTPLWQVNTVTWNQGTTPHTLRSEEEVLAAEAAGQVTITKTNIVVNCPVIFTPQGGLLPTAKIFLSNKEESAMAGIGAVYTETNNVTDNKIIRFEMSADGSLSMSGSFSTNGLGTGDSLGNQGGVILTGDGRNLLAVNAGSNEISVFEVKSNGLKLTDKVNSGGIMPISLTTKDDLVYVVNAGGNGNIAGFHLDDGKLSMISNSIKPLSNNSAGPAEISFNPDGDVLVVTEKNTNIIDTYTVDDNGIANGPFTHTSNGPTPFGFAFDKRGHLIVSEAPGSALSSYSVDEDGNLKLISGSVPDFHAAACWVVVTKNGKIAYTNNAHDGTISSYSISKKGVLSLLEKTAGNPGDGNIDLALSKDSKFLYSLNSVPNTIAGFKVNPDGSLTPVGTVGVPAGADGLAAR
jgi:6-phosphogluconolactonase (cycloisomerase 2 family)